MKILAIFFLVACLRAQTSDSEQDVLAIQDALQSGNLTGASHMIDELLARRPHDGGLLNLRGILHGRRNDVAEARNDFAEAVRLEPSLTPAWQNLARTCQLEVEHDPSAEHCAIESWQRVLRLKGKDSEAHLALAQLYEREAKYSDSLQQIGSLPAEVAARMPALLFRCADLTAIAGRMDDARKAARQLAGDREFSQADFAGVQNAFQAPRSAEVVVILVEGLDARAAAGLVALPRLAIAYEQLQRPSEARKTLERVAGLDPRNTAHLLELARLAEASGDHEGALGYLAHARDLTPENAQIHFLFAEIAMEMDLPVQARASLDRALELDPTNPAYDYGMGFVILTTRDAATAASYFQRFVNARPSDVKGHYALGVAYFAGGDYAKSKAEMTSVENRSEVAGGAEYFLGCMARREDDLDDAARHLRKSIELMPLFSESHTELARVSMIEGNLPAARTELDRAVQIDPNSFEGNVQLLAVYRRTHDLRAGKQADIVQKLDANRSRRAELMLRMIDARPTGGTSAAR